MVYLDNGNDESVPQARKHSRTERVSGSPVRQQKSLPPPPAYESTPHRKPAGRPELDGSIVTQARPATSSWDPVEELVTQETEMRATFPDNPWGFDWRYCHPSHATCQPMTF
ncbi:uncharacterized protein LOC144522286 isoform X2 [Sander vitreus]